MRGRWLIGPNDAFFEFSYSSCRNSQKKKRGVHLTFRGGFFNYGKVSKHNSVDCLPRHIVQKKF